MRFKPDRTSSPRQRFEQRIQKTDSCWLWIARKTPEGYGQLEFSENGRRRNVYAHRLSYELHNGPIPDGLFVCHKCDVRACVNPDHLFLGTHSENLADAVRKGRMHPGEAHGQAKLKKSEICDIRARYSIGGISQRTLAMEYKVSQTAIKAIVNRRTWKHLIAGAA